ncbi:MAG: hypothetical protein L6R39_003800 [Caloplaca ligustica]|nr:MAG: hypothetical protein L6R39_003800 [Caloplaca ligustica]
MPREVRDLVYKAILDLDEHGRHPDPTYVANVTVQGCEAKRRMAQAIALSWIQTPMIPPKYIKSIYVNLHAYVTGGMIIYWARGGGESAYMLQHLLDRFFAHGISFTEGANTQRPEYIEELNINLTTVVCDATSETFCSGYYSIQKTLKHMLLADDGALHERLGTVSMYVNGEVQQRSGWVSQGARVKPTGPRKGLGTYAPNVWVPRAPTR